ncbi:MAG TPA: DUF4915 domain-containing protein [Vicinamibacterales bacterium]|nr:DUF4915 domain-containing protein [Vicinamibacterales bacterium]
MTRTSRAARTALWSKHDQEWRNPAQVVSQWRDAAAVDPRLLRYTTRGAWWDTLAASGVTLLISREYEHLVVAMRADRDGPALSYMPLPHPSGIAYDRARATVYVASTRNPNQIYDLMAVNAVLPGRDRPCASLPKRALVPVRSRFYPGCLYMHDLAMIGGTLYVTAVGQNTVASVVDGGRFEPAWWPRCIDTSAGPIVDRNFIQLNSIAAGHDLNGSFFSASAAAIGRRRPGHRNFPVDRRGVIFSGRTREPIATGLTRPHSARLAGGRLWVNNSGYGEVGIVDGGRFVPVRRLPGWTRGLCVYRQIAYVGTSGVIPAFRHHAPGLRLEDSVCGIHAVDIRSGRSLGSLIWPYGNQVFTIEWVPPEFTTGFPFTTPSSAERPQTLGLFYAFQTTNGVKA